MHGQVPTPQLVEVGAPCVQAACGYSHTVVVTIQGGFVAFGDNSQAQLGNGTLASSSPERIQFHSSVPGKQLRAVDCGMH